MKRKECYNNYPNKNPYLYGTKPNINQPNHNKPWKEKPVANKNPFSKAFTINYRGSKRFNRVKKFIFNKTEKNSVLYLSNNLYKGYFGSLGTWTTDEGMANNEMRIINAVFKKLDKNIF